MYLVAFLDILGTKAAVSSGRFSDYHALDFSGAAGTAALSYPNVRIAVFSDSVVATSARMDAKEFLSAVGHMQGNWFSDGLLVRGGIAMGEINWVEHPAADRTFARAPNFINARLYGQALIDAHGLETTAGPGGIVSLTPDAATLFRGIEARSVLWMGPKRPVLCWATEREARGFLRHADVWVDCMEEEGEPHGVRHTKATSEYWALVVHNSCFLPDSYRPYTWPEVP